MSDNKNTPLGGPPPRGRRNDLITIPSSGLQVAPSRNGMHEAGASHQGITVRFVLNAMRQWWKVALPIGLVLAVVSTMVVYVLFEPQYEAVAWLQIQESAPYIAFPQRDGSRRFVETQVQLIHSPLVMGPVVSQPEIARLPEVEEEASPIDWLRKEIQVSSQGQSELFTISLEGPDAANAARIVNAVTKAYFELRNKDDAARTQKVIELLTVERERRAGEVDRLRESVRELTKQATGKDPFAAPSRETVVRHPLNDLQARLTTAEVERQILELEIQAFEETTSKAELKPQNAEEEISEEDPMVTQAVQQHPRIQGLELQMSAKEARLSEYKEKLPGGVDSPVYQRLYAEVERDRRALDDAREEVKREVQTTYNYNRKAQLADMRMRLKSYEAMEKLLREKCESERQDVELATGETLELEFMKAELARAETVHERIAERALQLMTENRAPARVTLLQAADVPTAPVKKVPYKEMAFALLASLCMPFALAVVWERLVRRVSDAQQLEQHSHLTVLGEVARLPVRTGVFGAGSSRRVGHDIEVFQESIDSLRTCLVLSEPLSDMKMLAVTSAANNEGKTSVAVQLAVSMARASGELTLLIDGDMRSPDIHKVLDVPLEPGLAGVLAGECTLEDAVITSWSDHVHILPAGRLHVSPHKLLGNGALKPLMEKVRASYRYVIIDTPPVLASGESLVLARAADASLICAMRDISRVDQVRLTHDRLLAASARPVGVVLNGIPTKRYAYRYGTYGYTGK